MKKSSIILSLLTLTAALASLPALGQSPIFYEPDITKYQFTDKVPLTSNNQTGNGKAWIQVTHDGEHINNLVNENEATWTSVTNGDYVQNLEHYDKDASNYTFTTSTENRGSWEWTTITNGTILRAHPQDGSWKQFRVVENIKVEEGESYVLSAWVRGSKEDLTHAKVYFGTGGGNENYFKNAPDGLSSFEIHEDWTLIEIPYGPATAAAGNSTSKFYCEIQRRGYTGDLEVKDVKLTTSNKKIIHSADYANGDAFTGKSYEGTARIKEENGMRTLAISHSIGSFKLYRDINLSAGTVYKAKIQISGSVEGNVTLQLGSSEKQIALPVRNDDTFGEVEVIFDPQNNDKNGANLILKPDNYAGTIKVQSTTLYSYNTEVVKHVNFDSEASLPSVITQQQQQDMIAYMYFDADDNRYYLRVKKAIGAFHIIENVNFKKDAIYTLKIGARAYNTDVTGIRLALGNWTNGGTFINGNLSSIPSSEYDQNIIGSFNSFFAADLNNGFCDFQLYYTNQFDHIDIGFAELSCIDLNNEILIGTETYTQNNTSYADEYCPEKIDGVLVAQRNAKFHFQVSATDNNGNNIVYEPNKKYKITLKLKGTEETQGTLCGLINGKAESIRVTNQWETYTTKEFSYDTGATGEYSIFSGWEPYYSGDVEIASISLWEEGDGEPAEIGDPVTTINTGNAGFLKYSDTDEGGLYTSYYHKHDRYFLALKDQKFNHGTQYYVTAKVRGSRASEILEDGSKEGVNIIVQNSKLATPEAWGWGFNATGDNTNHDNTKHAITTDWSTITTSFAPTENIPSDENDGNGFISFHLGDYDGDFEVDWIHVTTNANEVPSLTTSAVRGNNGCNYFDITLPNHGEEETYFFMIGRNANDLDAPLNFEVLNAETGESYGNYAVGGKYDRNNINVRWEQFLTKTEIITDEKGNELEQVQVGVTVPANVTKLHFVCTSNVGDNYVFLTENGKVFDVPVMSMNRVAVYKQRTLTQKDSEGNPTWVYPLISRFQIEANGIPGNYPGQFKKSYYKQENPVKDSDSYASKGETLMDAVDNMLGEWGKYQSPGQLLFDSDNTERSYWASSTWMTSDNWRNEETPYSIDLLLPNFIDNKSGQKKSLKETLENAGLIENGKIKLMVWLLRPAEFDRNGNPTTDNNYFPTEIRYAGTTDTGLDENGKSNGYVTMNDAEWETVNLQIPPSNETMNVAFSIDVDPTWRRVRLLCNQNKNSTTPEHGGREMAISDIRVFIALPKLNLAEFNYDVLYNERLDDIDKKDVCEKDNQDKLVKLSNYKWTHTIGIAETAKDNINDPNKWVSDWTNLIQQINGTQYGNAALELAKFEYVNSNTNSDIDGITSRTRLSNGWNGDRQPTYTMTHEILALPGERVDLYPYSDLHESMYYMDHIVRWYDYMTDQTPDYLFFLTDPKAVIKTTDGFLGGKILMDGPYHGPGSVGSVYFDPNTDISEKWIAADFSISVTDNFRKRFDGHGTDGNKKFYEPILSFRHVFHIKNARTFAEEFSKGYKANIDYVTNNRRYISARQNADFTIRLEHPMPVDKETASDLYYKAEDGSYKRVCSYDIRAYKTSTFRANESNISSTNVEPGSVGLINGSPMFEPYHISDDRTSKYKSANSIVDIKGTDKRFLDEREFYRAIYCKADNIRAAIEKTKSNKFLVRVYGKDKDGNIIKVYGTEDKPLVVAEYEVEFLPDTEASFLPEYAETLKEGGTHYTHSEAYLDMTFNDPDKVSRRDVNFDKYSVENLTNIVGQENIDKLLFAESKTMRVNVMKIDEETNEPFEYNPDNEGNTETKEIGVQSGNRLKLPLDWSASNYSFAYNADGDYNMFRLADHSSATVYQTGASRRTDNPIDQTQNNTAQRGTYDRTFYNNNGTKKGMFYYVNAASDPGDIVEINVANPCAGSTLYVSGWVNEFNDHMPETANLIVNYYANIVTDDNPNDIARKIQIHGFETGYVPNGSKGMDIAGIDGYYKADEGNQGVWMHFYYSFVPSAARVAKLLKDGESVASYSLVLENNSISSRGADYAIDEIRAYVAPPIVEVEQLDPLCNDIKIEDENQPINIEVRIPYDALLEAFELDENQLSEDDKTKSLYFAVVNKSIYDKKLDDLKKDKDFDYANNQQAAFNMAFAEGVLSYDQIHNGGKEQSWGSVTFNTTYLENNGFNKANYPIGHTMYHDVDGERYISFITNPPVKSSIINDENNREFMIVIAEDKDGTMAMDESINGETLAQKLKFGTQCCRQADFKLTPPTDILINGVLQGNRHNITCCENQHPVVQVILNDKDGNALNLKQNEGDDAPQLVIDWYAGSYDDFSNEYITATNETSTNGMSLWQVLYNFRSDYPNETDCNQYCKGETGDDGELKNPNAKSYTSAMRTYLGKLIENQKLYLNQATYIFPEVSFKDDDGNPLTDEEGNVLTNKKIYVTAIPVDNNGTLLSADGNPICMDPTEVEINVTKTSPVMKNGFESDKLVYPDQMLDVPLRAGLKHLDKVSANGNAPSNNGDDITLIATANSEKLIMPLRGLVNATATVTKFKPLDSDPYCYLAATNDPDEAFQKVYRESFDRISRVNLLDDDSETESNKYYSEYELPLVGEISLETEIDGSGFNNVQVTFYKDKINFKEGYYYTFKFPYEEDYETDGFEWPAGIDQSSKPCHGETLFTIKVVPEYQVWTGGASLNWNNDENWSRVKKETLLTDSDTPKSLSSDANSDNRFLITDGSNDNTFAYAPLDFTKVIIPAGATYPQLAERKHDRAATNGTVSVKNGHGDAAVSYAWVDSDPMAATEAGNGDKKESAADANATTKTPSYLPTQYVQYDMAASTYTGETEDGNVYCRPWYANACDQIHFNSNAEILNQQNLDYQKAWVDMEMKPDQWYNVASPLYGVVAGDMYLPKTDARQANELFTDIKFNTTDNDRFHPAVFQRGWDKGTETVYNIKEGDCPKEETVALASTWSHVYNDVTDQYKVGAGYSVKTDVSRYADATNNTEFAGLVKFRFPKADTDYQYFTDDSNTGKDENDGVLNRDNKHRLFEGEGEIELTKATAGTLFLVGNPFMAHLDMTKFLAHEKNSDVIEGKYWILNGDNQIAWVMDHNNENAMLSNETLTSGKMTATSATTGKLAPMQGFFVQTKDTEKKLTLKLTFTSEMMAVEPYDDSKGLLVKAPARMTRADDDDIIRVSTGESTAIIRLNASADKGYAASEDVEMIDDSNQRGMRRIYTVAGTMAAAINQTPDADGVEVGLMAPTDSVTTVTFNGAALEDYLLYDTATGEMTPLHDGFELEMAGSVSGRYFLTSGIDTAEIEDGTIRIVPARHEVVVTAPAVCGDLTVRVYDTLGREIATAEGFAEEVRISLDPGIYVIDAEGSEKGRKAAKVSIR